MADQQLNIHLKLKDDFTRHLTGITDKVNELGRTIEHAGRQMNQMGSRMTFLGTAITGSFMLAMKGVADYSPTVNKTFNELGNSLKQLQIVVAEIVAPVFERFTNVVSNVVAWFKALDPHLRQTILQATFLGGVFLMVGGIALKMIGSMMTLFGRLLTMINPVTIALAAIVAATILIIKYWDEVKGYVIPIINALEIGAKMVAIGFLKIVDAIIMLIEKVQRFVPAWREAARGTAEARANIKRSIDGMEADISKILETHQGKWADTVDKTVVGIQGMWEKIKSLGEAGTQTAKTQIFRWAEFTNDIVRRLASQMEQSLGNFFYNALTGQLKSAQEMFADFGRAVLQILTQALAKLILFQTVGKAFEGMLGFNMFQFHQGGVVRRAHSGMMASDEVPIIAQSGEGIVSRKGMNALGIEGFNKLNKGEQARGGSETPQIVVYQAIHAWDYRDVYRNRKVIANGIIEEIRKNGDFRTAMREYR